MQPSVQQQNPRDFLLQMCKKRRLMPVYDFIGFEGSAHRPIFHFGVTAGGFRAEGKGSNKKEAKSNAAAAFLLRSGRLFQQATEADEPYAVHHGRYASQTVTKVDARDDHHLMINSVDFDPDVTLTHVSPSVCDIAMDVAPVDEQADPSSHHHDLATKTAALAIADLI